MIKIQNTAKVMLLSLLAVIVFACDNTQQGQSGKDQGALQQASLESLQRKLGSKKIIAVACGATHSLALASNGNVWATGLNICGELGVGDYNERNYWVETGQENIIAIACGIYHSLALSSDGKVYGTGLNSFGQLALDKDISKCNTWQYTDRSDVKAIACGGWHSLVILNNNALWGTGSNSRGQLGHGNKDRYYGWKNLKRSDVRAIAGGEFHSLYIDYGSGRLYVTGANDKGQLGYGQNDYHSWEYTGRVGYVKIACGRNHSLALRHDGKLIATGDNRYGELGLGHEDTVYHWATTKSSGSGVKAIAAGSGQSLYVKRKSGKDRVYGAGDNRYGNLGLGTIEWTSDWKYTNVYNVIDMDCGFGHSLLLSNTKRVWGSGWNGVGQLGLGRKEAQYTFTRCP